MAVFTSLLSILLSSNDFLLKREPSILIFKLLKISSLEILNFLAALFTASFLSNHQQ